ncbi:MAG: hypothetical protein QOJ64_1045 [Acidobacteriota bacterium]|jgi:hypothetical protein|nr:hypothetical protein [Acidobacteriota bacterium]
MNSHSGERLAYPKDAKMKNAKMRTRKEVGRDSLAQRTEPIIYSFLTIDSFALVVDARELTINQ